MGRSAEALRDQGLGFPAEDAVAPDEVVRVMDRVHTLDVAAFEPSFLVRTLERRAQATGSVSALDYLTQRLVQDHAEATAFHRSLRVSYTSFFRDPFTFALLESRVIRDLMADTTRPNRGALRVWSAGCATGQEAWSMAILLDELASSPEQHRAWRIFGTDLSESDLAVANSGVYSAEEVSNVRLRHLNACFTRQGTAFAVATRLREHVGFAPYDLLDATTTCPPASIFGGFDLVLCCNVLLYYRRAQQSLILDKLVGCLVPGGYLVVGETERQIAQTSARIAEVPAQAPTYRVRKR
jgi:chemotaxis protein methyltransferase CheR